MVVGLGNPGPEYRGTRHNVGFDVIERLASQHRIETKTLRHSARFGTGEVEGNPVALVMPLTFMNLSGRAVVALARSWNIKPESILVITDDMDLPVGKVRMRLSGGSGGHNGHKSISGSLGSQDYPRIRIGVGRPADETIEHVLSRFTPIERQTVNEAIAKACEAIEKWCAGDADAAMRVANEG